MAQLKIFNDFFFPENDASWERSPIFDLKRNCHNEMGKGNSNGEKLLEELSEVKSYSIENNDISDKHLVRVLYFIYL